MGLISDISLQYKSQDFIFTTLLLTKLSRRQQLMMQIGQERASIKTNELGERINACSWHNLHSTQE